MYKAEGDGFQRDALCDSGYTFTFYFRNQNAPTKYLRKGFSPLHLQILTMFDNQNPIAITFGLTNLYLSAKFCKGKYIIK